MAQSFTEMLASIRSGGDAPNTEEFAKYFAEIQEELKPQPKPTLTVRELDAAEARAILVIALKQLERGELPKLIATIELLRRQLGMSSLLYKQVGDCLR